MVYSEVRTPPDVILLHSQPSDLIPRKTTTFFSNPNVNPTCSLFSLFDSALFTWKSRGFGPFPSLICCAPFPTDCFYFCCKLAVTYIDSSAVQALKDLYHEYRSRNIQIAVSNPNRDVLLTLTRAEVVDLIGREWFFVRVHDAVQVCLQHVQSLTDSSMSQSPLLEKKSSLFNRLLKQRSEEAALSQLESGNREISASRDDAGHLEPLLSKKT
ncbi:uncharacterized protein LOC131012984 [Salvia miltiorrhiza]|uniref:uncharacterized protein LOC131012984 n=1 Tax=Salvia miltiorrhiza TaxID=226208 RepID=UPI0025AC1F15|nr:uncharacterized protein LOC131012984 [Salvia miltiorrhiza]